MKHRHQQIIDLLTERTFLKIEEICTELNVSPATVRRDLSQIEETGRLRRINGGAIIQQVSTKDLQIYKKVNFDEKKRIAEEAVSYVKEGYTIFLDSGSTNSLIADKLSELSNITVVTNSVEIAYKFINRKELSVIICGGALGEVNPDSIVGPVAEKMISMFRANLCFLGTSALHIKHGITDTHLSLARIKANMIEHSTQIICVADHSKFGTINAAFVCNMEQVNHIITGVEAPEDDIEYLRHRGIRVTTV